MATLIRPEISEKNKYHINKHRHYELKHFCLQYPSWKKEYTLFGLSSSTFDRAPSGNTSSDLTAKYAMENVYYSERISLIEKIAMETDEFLHVYILKAVTEELSFTYLKSKLNIPCSRDAYYERYRKFFWLLSNARR